MRERRQSSHLHEPGGLKKKGRIRKLLLIFLHDNGSVTSSLISSRKRASFLHCTICKEARLFVGHSVSTPVHLEYRGEGGEMPRLYWGQKNTPAAAACALSIFIPLKSFSRAADSAHFISLRLFFSSLPGEVLGNNK